ncbi:MAG: CcmD family protein [Actinomycetota bacterium]|jgi:CcmD family protein
MDDVGYLGVAFVLVWFGIVVFLISVTRRQKALEKRVEELRRTANRGPVE